MDNDLLDGHFFEIVQSIMEHQKISVDDFFSHHIPIVFETNQSNCFPARDIDEVRFDNEKVIIVCNFLGLSGVPSPLPYYLNELSARDEGKVFKAFLDAISQRFFVLYFLAGFVFQVETPRQLQWISEKNNSIYRQSSELSSQTLYAFEAACTLFFGHKLVKIEKKPDWIELEASPVLGSSLTLGDNSILGARILKENQSVSFMIDGCNMKEIFTWLKQSRLQSFNKSIERSFWAGYGGLMKLHPVSEDRMYLGQNVMRLGIDSWIQPVMKQSKKYRQPLVTFGLQPSL